MVFVNDFSSSEAEEVEKDDSYNLELENGPEDEDFNDVSSDEDKEVERKTKGAEEVEKDDSYNLELENGPEDEDFNEVSSDEDKEVERMTKGQVKRCKNTGDESNTVADTIINAFIVKRRKALVDQEEFEIDIVSYETSEKRLIVLAAILALSFCFIISI